MSIVLAAAAASLFASGTYLLLQRELTRIILGLGLLAHGANLFILMGAGSSGRPAFVGSAGPDEMLDPLPQAFVLTAIVISFGVTTFLLGLAYRSWVLTHDDEVPDDLEDRRVAMRRARTEIEHDLALADVERDGELREVAHDQSAHREAGPVSREQPR
jgi:multicomponent Na+:H+ antiporter subunit C